MLKKQDLSSILQNPTIMFHRLILTPGLKGENLRHDHVLITVNIFIIKRK